MGEAAIKIEEEELVPIEQLLREELKKAHDNREVVIASVRKRAIADPSFWEAYRVEACVALARQGLSRIMNSERNSSVGAKTMPPIPVNGYDSMRNSVRATVQHFMDYPLGRKKLRNATQGEIEIYANQLVKMSKTLEHRGRWLVLVARALPDKKTTVGRALDEGKLESLWRKVA